MLEEVSYKMIVNVHGPVDKAVIFSGDPPGDFFYIPISYIGIKKLTAVRST
jgi:hypothetical protein